MAPNEKHHEADGGHPPMPNIVIRSPSMSTPKLFQSGAFRKASLLKEDSPPTVSEDSSLEPPRFQEMSYKACVAGVHDLLEVSRGLGWSIVLSGKWMEFMVLFPIPNRS